MKPQPWHQDLGEMPDRELAAKWGVGYKNVARVRKLFGIPPMRPTKKPLHRPWHKLAGTMRDSDLARRFGISKTTVGRYRRSKGIPRFGEGSEPLTLNGSTTIGPWTST